MGSTRWTPDEMGDLGGRRVVVTGANSGIGFEAAKGFAAAGADVVMACRSTDRGAEAAGRIRESVAPPGDVELVVRECDLASLSSVRSFADRTADDGPLDVLVNNAGVMAIPYRETEDGFEQQFGVNHLGHFALTGRLLESVLDADGRVVTVSSGAHERGDVDPEAVRSGIGRAGYGKWDAYARSKLANLLFANELQRRLAAAGADARSLGVHPGYAATGLQRRGPEMTGSTLRLYAMRVANAVLAQSAERGAWPTLRAATDPELTGGEYLGPGGALNARGHPVVQEPSSRARDPDLARELWAVSEELTGVTYDLPTAAAPADDRE